IPCTSRGGELTGPPLDSSGFIPLPRPGTGGLLATLNHLSGGSKEDGARLSSVVADGRTRSSHLKLQQGKFRFNKGIRLDIRKNLLTRWVVKYWNRLSRGEKARAWSKELYP
uniref:Uncharacterized protein n=1 Tax=Crocodylus porosus TaxID=8502 RepID=A0A7M4F6J0_CROPO